MKFRPPHWKEENKETYRKMIQAQINRLERKLAISDYESKKLIALKNKLKESQISVSPHLQGGGQKGEKNDEH